MLADVSTDRVKLSRAQVSYFGFLPSTCDCEAREPLTYSGMRLRAPSATLDGNWTYAPGRLRSWLLELLDGLVFTTGGGRNAGMVGLRVFGIGSTY